MKIDYMYRCSERHWVVSSDHLFDESPCPAMYGSHKCEGSLDGPYVDILIMLVRMEQDEEHRELGKKLQEALGIEYL